jgi:hypothetical protein
MQPQVYQGEFFRVNTSAGTETVPADVLSLRVGGVEASILADYLEGTPDDPQEIIPTESGWLARMSAPGYLDCTDWTAHNTEAEALAYLAEMYGDDTDEEGGE